MKGGMTMRIRFFDPLSMGVITGVVIIMIASLLSGVYLFGFSNDDAVWFAFGAVFTAMVLTMIGVTIYRRLPLPRFQPVTPRTVLQLDSPGDSLSDGLVRRILNRKKRGGN